MDEMKVTERVFTCTYNITLTVRDGRLYFRVNNGPWQLIGDAVPEPQQAVDTHSKGVIQNNTDLEKAKLEDKA